MNLKQIIIIYEREIIKFENITKKKIQIIFKLKMNRQRSSIHTHHIKNTN